MDSEPWKQMQVYGQLHTPATSLKKITMESSYLLQGLQHETYKISINILTVNFSLIMLISFSHAMKFLWLNCTLTVSIFTTDSLLLLYFTSVRSKPEYASVAWNSIPITDSNKL